MLTRMESILILFSLHFFGLAHIGNHNFSLTTEIKARGFESAPDSELAYVMGRYHIATLVVKRSFAYSCSIPGVTCLHLRTLCSPTMVKHLSDSAFLSYKRLARFCYLYLISLLHYSFPVELIFHSDLSDGGVILHENLLMILGPCLMQHWPEEKLFYVSVT